MSYTSRELENIMASLVRYLLENNEKEAAHILLPCRIDSIDEESRYDSYDPDPESEYSVTIVRFRGPLKSCGIINSEDGKIPQLIASAFRAILFETSRDIELWAKYELVEVDTDWRSRLLAESETQQATNQNPYAKEPIIYQGMKFNSPPEVKIAEALERAGVMYLPSCILRIGGRDNRQTRIPDFLICYQGKWGILEVDGQTYHTSESATKDYERSRLIQQHIKVYFDRFPANRCLNEPDLVVREFLSILEKQ